MLHVLRRQKILAYELMNVKKNREFPPNCSIDSQTRLLHDAGREVALLLHLSDSATPENPFLIGEARKKCMPGDGELLALDMVSERKEVFIGSAAYGAVPRHLIGQNIGKLKKIMYFDILQFRQA